MRKRNINEVLENWRPRASGIGSIISKSGKFTDTIKTELLTRYVELREGIKNEISSKYFEKGNACEQQAIDLLNRSLFPYSFITSYKVNINNEYIRGTPDILHRGYLIDIKNAYDVFTFEKAQLTWDYEWQLKAYMWLTNTTKGFVFYSLIDMPEHLFADEERKMFYKGNYITMESPEYLQDVEELRKRYIYSDKPDEDRFKIFPVVLTPEDIERIKLSVIEARTYLLQLNSEFLDNSIQNLHLINDNKNLNDLFK